MVKRNPVEEVYRGKKPVAVCGAGYVGLSLAAVYLRHNLRVILVDINESKLRSIASKSYQYVERDVEAAINKGLDEKRLELTTDCTAAAREAAVIVMTVPIHLDWDEKKILYASFDKGIESIGRGLEKGDLVIVESSVPPGTTEERVKPLLESASGLLGEEDFYLVYSPERIYVGRAVRDIEENYPKIVAGIGPRSASLGEQFYKPIAKRGVLLLPRPRDAEFEKLAEGIYRDLNIALANELALAAMRLGVDFYAAREAANTAKPYINIHLPGPGVGGACIPIYPYFMSLKLLERGFTPKLVLLGRERNELMPFEVVKLVEKMARKFNINKTGAKVALLGVAFRGDVDDSRLSPTHDVASLLVARGYKNIVAHDPYVTSDEILENIGARITRNLDDALNGADIVVILTRHTAYKDLRLSEVVSRTGKEPIIIDAINYVKRDMEYGKLLILGRYQG